MQKSTTENNPVKIRVCAGHNCAAKGARSLMHRIESETGVKSGDVSPDYDVDYCACTGFCHLAPNVVVNGNYIHEADENSLMEKIHDAEQMESLPETLREADLERILQGDMLGDI